MSVTDAEVAALAVRAAAEEAMRHFRRDVEVRAKRSASDPVSEADEAAQGAMVEAIAQHRPEDGLLGEEEGLARRAERTWLLDPVDGTLAFLAGQPLWSCAACLRDGDGTRVAAVFDPVADELFLAERDGAATLNGRPIATAGASALRSAVVRTWCDPHVAARADYLAVLSALATSAAALQAGGSGSQALAWVACGRLDGWIEIYPSGAQKAWDWHPGELLVRGAGGAAHELGEWRIAAANPALADEIADILSSSSATAGA